MAWVALVDLSHMCVVAITGPDRLSWVHNLTTQHIMNLEPGVSTELILLTAEGRIQVPAAVVDDGETLFLIADVGQGAQLAEFLQKMRFMLRVEVALRHDLSLLGGIGEFAGAGARLLRGQTPGRTVPGRFRCYGVPAEEHPAFGRKRFIALVPTAEKSEALDEWGGKMAGMLAWEAQRIVDLRPRPALDKGREVASARVGLALALPFT